MNLSSIVWISYAVVKSTGIYFDLEKEKRGVDKMIVLSTIYITGSIPGVFLLSFGYFNTFLVLNVAFTALRVLLFLASYTELQNSDEKEVIMRNLENEIVRFITSIACWMIS